MMCHIRHCWKTIVTVVLLAFILSGTTGAIQAQAGQADGVRLINHSWEHLRQANRYEFATQIEQVTYPAPRLTNVGRSSTKEFYAISGQTDLAAEMLLLSFGQNQASSFTNSGLEIRIEQGVAWGRAGLEDWQRLDEFSADLFAPGNDAASFLSVARNVHFIEATTLPLPSAGMADRFVDHYRFDVDGRAYAQIIHQQMVEQLQRTGKLPMGMNLSTSDELNGVTGSGEVWIGQDELPLRLKISLVFPQQSNGERVEAFLTTDFFNFDQEALFAAQTWPRQALAALGLPTHAEAWKTLANETILVLGILLLIGWLSLTTRKKVAYLVTAALVIFTMVSSPLWEGAQAAAFNAEIRHKQAAAEQPAPSTDTHTDWDANSSPWEQLASQTSLFVQEFSAGLSRLVVWSGSNGLSMNSPQAMQQDGQGETEADADGDGLTDAFEGQFPITVLNPASADTDSDGLRDGEELALNLLPGSGDSDKDSIPDLYEVQPIDLGTQKLYSNPLNPDTDRDGILDGIECPERVPPDPLPADWVPGNCRNTDTLDELDIFDSDDDNDGVPTVVDDGPYLRATETYSQTNPLSLTLSGVESDRTVFVNYQLRPVNEKHLTYALNVLDWPSGDADGQIQRISDTTFGSNLPPARLEGDPRAAYGDLRLIPMLEVQLSGSSLPLPLTTTMILTDTVNDFSGEFSFSGQAGTTTIALRRGAAGSSPVYLGQGSCDEFQQVARIGDLAPGGSGGSVNVALRTLASGGYVLYVKDAADSLLRACIPIIPRAHGTQNDAIVDTSLLDAYGISARNTLDGSVLLYAPLNLVSDFDGSLPVAFGARIPFNSVDGGFTDSQQQVRIVWMINMLTDRCLAQPADYDTDSGTWCDATKPERWVTDQAQVVHIYNEEFKLAGLSVVEERGVEMAVAFENPAKTTGQVQDALWGLLMGLERSFYTGRDSDTDGNLDLTPAEVVHRFDPEHNQDIPDDDPRLWGMPRDSFQVESYTYAFSDGIYKFMQSQVNDLFNTYFHSGLADRPSDATLLFARHSKLRSLSAGSAGVTCTAGHCTFEFNGIEEITQALLNWAPYQREGETWRSYPQEDYLDLLEARLRSRPDYQPADESLAAKYIIDGRIALARSHYTSYVGGVITLVALDSVPVIKFEAQEPDAILQDFIEGSGDITKEILETVSEDVINGMDKNPNNATDPAVKNGADGLQEAVGEAVAQPDSPKASKLSKVLDATMTGLAVLGFALNVANTILALDNSDSNDMRIAKRVLGTITGVVETINAIKDLVDAIQAFRAAEALTKAAKTVAVVGLVIGIAIAWGTFIAVIAISGIAMFSLAFNQMLAETIAATVVLVILFVIAMIPLVGQIIVAVIALIDAIIMGLCAAFGAEEALGEDHWVNEWICGGISGAAAKVIAWTIYSNNYMIDLHNSERLTFTDLAQDLRDLSLGYSSGNAISMTVALSNTITLSDIPFDWKAAIYFWQYSESTARSSTFAYKVQPSEVDIHDNLDRGAISSNWIDVEDGKKWVQHFDARTDGSSIPMPEPGINRDPGVFVSEGSAVPVQECWAVPIPFWWLLPICYIRTERATFQNPLGESLTMDVFPATLDDFYSLTDIGEGGYSLAWGRDASLTFDAFQDADGDSLVSTRSGGSDPDDGFFDKDGDTLSDSFELAQGTNPLDFDTDGDGLHDADEIRLGSSPNRPDSDGDGLPDQEELFGWLFTYGFASDGTPFETMVYPDINEPDSDFDGITDKLEKVYGFNPQAPSKAEILDYSLSLRELDAPVVLLRLDEIGEPVLFADSSNFAFNAVCSMPACPVSGLAGRYAQAVRLDGNAVLRIPTSAQALDFANSQPFTLGAWVFWDGSTGGTLLAKWSEAVGARQELRLEITAGGTLLLTGSGASASSSGVIPANTWNHIAAAYNGSQVTFYMNGSAIGSAVWSSTPSGSTPVEITVGAYQGMTQPEGYFSGGLDEVIIYDRYLIAPEITTRMVAARYNLNDTFVRPAEYFFYRSTVENLLNSRFAYGLLTTLFEPQEAIDHWQEKLQPITFVLRPDNPVVQGVNTVTLTDTLQISSTMTSSSLVINQTAAGQIVDRRSESNLAELWLTFDQTVISGTTQLFEDTSGWMPPRDAACTGACNVSGQGILNNAVRFVSGGNTPVTLPALNQMNLVDRSFTFAMWIKPSAGGSTLNLIDSPGDRLAIFLQNVGGNYVPEVTLNGTEITTGGIARQLLPDVWSHLVVRYASDTQSLDLFVNGAQVAHYASVVPAAADALLVLGGAPQNADYLVDDLRIFSRPLSSLDINLLAERPVLKLNMDTPYTDASGYGQTVAGVQSPEMVAGSVRGNSLRPSHNIGAYTPKGLLQVNGNELLNLQDGTFTFSLWAKPYSNEPSSDWQGILGYNSGTSSAYPTIERQGARIRFGFGALTGWWEYITGNILNVDQWNHLVVTFRPSPPPGSGYELVIYVNGEEKTSTIAPNPPANNSETFFVGHSSHQYTSTAVGYQMDSYSDEWLDGDPDVYIDRYDPGYTRIYGESEDGTGYHGINVARTYTNYETATYQVWDADFWSADDFCGSATHTWYSFPGLSSVTLSNGFEGHLDVRLDRSSVLFNGEIDEVEIYRYGLDREQVYDLYNAIPITARLPLDDRPASTSFDNRAFVGVQDNGICNTPGCPAAGTVGLINQAVRFDGFNDVIEAPVDTTADYMVSLWFNTTCSNCGLYSLWSDRTGGEVRNQLYLKNGNVCASTGGSEMCSHGGGLNNEQWHFVTYSNNNGDRNLNLDGVVVNTLINSNLLTPAPNGEAHLGFAPDAGQTTLNGQLDDVRVFRYSQADEVVALLRQRAPLALFHLDEARPSESFRTATPDAWTLGCSGDSCPQAGMEGRLGTAVEFDGQDDQLSLNQAPFANDTQSFSVGLWVMPYIRRAQPQLLWAINDAANSQRYAALLDTNTLQVCVRVGSDETCDLLSTSPLIKDNWNYLTLVVDRVGGEERYRLYINGYIDSSGSQTGFSDGVRGLLAGTGFNGMLDELTVYQYSLNEIEVRNIFNYQVAQVEENASLTLQIDAAAPTVSLASFNSDFPYLNGDDQVLHVEAVDFIPQDSLASGIGMVQMLVEHRNITQTGWKVIPACLDSTAGTSFCPTFDPNQGDGRYTLTFEATDQVGNVSQLISYTLKMDDTPPIINTNLVANSLQMALPHPTDPKTWLLALDGSLFDPDLGDGAQGSGLELGSVRVTVYSQANEVIGEGMQIPTLTPVGDGYQWTLDYRFLESEPTGLLRVVVEAQDRVGNRQMRSIPIRLDATPPGATLNTQNLPQPDPANLEFDPGEAGFILTGAQPNGIDLLLGDVDDTPPDGLPYITTEGRAAASGVERVEAAFTPAVDVSYLFNEPYPPGLLAWLPLDEAKQPVDENGVPDPAATTRLFLDISPYQQAGVCQMPYCPQTGFVGHRQGATYFDGTFRYINLGQDVSLSQKAFTISIWARPLTTNASQAILWQGPASIPGQRFLFGLNDTHHFVCGFGGTDLLTSQAYADLDWHHWACTYDLTSRVRTIYRDGVAVASDLAAPMPSRPENLYLGMAPVGSFNGYLDELVVLDHALDAQALQAFYVGDNQVYHLTVTERFLKSGDTLGDASGFFHKTLLQAGPGDLNNKVTGGKVGAFAVQLDGNDRLVVPEADSLDLSDGRFTQTAWVFPQANLPMDVISERDENPEQRYPSISLTADGRIQVGFGNRYAWLELFTEPVIAPQAWNFIAASFDGTTYRVYVNGVLAWSSSALAGMQPYASARFNIGEGFVGLIDDVRIYPRPLSAFEIWMLNGLSWQTADLEANPVPNTPIHWTLDLMPGLEGPYQIDARGWDRQAHFDIASRVYNQWGGVVDTLQPRITIHHTPVVTGDDQRVNFFFEIEDLYLDENSVQLNMCSGPITLTHTYYNSGWYLARGLPPNTSLFTLQGECQGTLTSPYPLGVYACDVAGNCASAEYPYQLQYQVYLPIIMGGQAQAVQQPPGKPAKIPEEAIWLSQAEIAHVDETQPPELSIASEFIGQDAVRSPLFINLYGGVADETGLASVNIRILQNDVEIYQGRAAIYDNVWNALWMFQPGHPPQPGQYILEVTATDQAGNQTIQRKTITVDYVP